MKKNRIKLSNVLFSPFPEGGHRFIHPGDDKVILETKSRYSLRDDKLNYPSIFENVFNCSVITNLFPFTFEVKGKNVVAGDKRYRWNNADVKGVLKLFCSPDDRRIILPSGIHDYMLEFKNEIYAKIKHLCTPQEFRRLTSDVFIHLCIQQGFPPLKAKAMGNLVDFFQKHHERKKWNSLGALSGK